MVLQSAPLAISHWPATPRSPWPQINSQAVIFLIFVVAAQGRVEKKQNRNQKPCTKQQGLKYFFLRIKMPFVATMNLKPLQAQLGKILLFISLFFKLKMFPSEHSYRHLGRIPSLNDNGRRFFGKDITNIDKRNKKNSSIYEKVPVASKMEPKVRARSLYGKKEPQVAAVLPVRDPLCEYKQPALQFMLSIQKKEPVDSQKHISEKMRQILIDWLIDVHQSFELKQQTLHLALIYLADYSALKQISKEDYQLVGIACLWIASKYEQIYPPRTKNYVEVTADTYSIKDLKDMEGNIIETLKFNLNRTTAYQLLEAVCHEKQAASEKMLSFCKYVMELALFEGLFRKYEPSMIVSSALSLCEKVFKCRLQAPAELGDRSSRAEIAECFKNLCVLMQSDNKYDLGAVRRKYGKSKYQNISKIKFTLNQ